MEVIFVNVYCEEKENMRRLVTDERLGGMKGKLVQQEILEELKRKFTILDPRKLCSLDGIMMSYFEMDNTELSVDAAVEELMGVLGTI